MIISCGEALVDVVVNGSRRVLPGGGPMNVAVSVARLGAPSAFVGRVSTDEYGDLIWQHLVDSGVVMTAAQRGPEPTAIAYAEGDPPRWRFEGNGTADTQLRSADFTSLGTGPHMLHGGTLGLFREPAASTLALLAESHNGIVSLDPNVRPNVIEDRARWMDLFNRWLAVTDIFKCSTEDCRWIWPEDPCQDVAEILLAAGVTAVLITHGAGGSTTYLPAATINVPGVKVDVVDTVGSGDAFIGSILAELWRRGATTPATLRNLQEADWVNLTLIANQVASMTAARAGADSPSRAELNTSLV